MALRSKILGDSLLKVNEGSSIHAHGSRTTEINTLAPRTLCVEYIWISGQAVSGLAHELRSKMRTFVQEPKDICDYPEWVVDGTQSQSLRAAPTPMKCHATVPIACRTVQSSANRTGSGNHFATNFRVLGSLPRTPAQDGFMRRDQAGSHPTCL
jgi:hypothetical protein